MSIFPATAAGSARRLMMSVVVAVLVSSGAPVPSASADQCPDVEVVFARGTGEPPGIGSIGNSFVDALRTHLGSRSLGVYAVDYPASTDYSDPSFPVTVVDGIRDARSHIEWMAASCPETREVLGGYSQGAALAGYATSDAVPSGVPATSVSAPMPPEIANHVAAVTLFGTPSGDSLQKYRAPALVIGPLYQPKTLQLCAQGDAVCGGGSDPAAHVSYGLNGMTSQAADFASSHL